MLCLIVALVRAVLCCVVFDCYVFVLRLLHCLVLCLIVTLSLVPSGDVSDVSGIVSGIGIAKTLQPRLHVRFCACTGDSFF